MSEPNQPIFLAELQVQFTIDGRLVAAPAKVFQRLWPRPQVVLEISNVQRDPRPISQSYTGSAFPLMSEGPSTIQLASGIQTKVVPNSWFPRQQEAELLLQQSPCSVFNSGTPMVSLQFDVLNITGDLFHWPLVLQAPPWLVKIDPVLGLNELEKALRSGGGFAFTHSGAVQRSDGKGFYVDDAQFFLVALGQFLSFVCGTQCGITNTVGFDSKGEEAWKQWGSYDVSPWQRRRSWADMTIRDGLSSTFEHFWKEYLNESVYLDRVLGWYVCSNETAALDLSIVLNQTVLEILVSLLPSGKGTEGPSGSRIACMLKKEGIDPQIPANCSELIALARHYSFDHGPHVLAAIRNSIVHAKAELGHPAVDAFYEAKQLGLWYVELLLLKMFNHAGDYACRLTDVQRPGATELVPWARDDQLYQ